MNAADPFPDLVEPAEGPQLVLDIEGFEGPIDLLLTLARDQKVDLAQISILQLADQYLAFVAEARALRLELAADYLVMAAWLAYLKSRLLLPTPAEAEEEPTPAQLAEALAFQMQRLQAMQTAAIRLMARPRLGQAVFARGAPEPLRVVTRARWELGLFELLRAYAGQQQRRRETRLTIEPSRLYSVEVALKRLEGLLGRAADWQSLSSFLPPGLRSGVVGRSAMAATLVASLELAKAGRLRLRQDGAFGPIYVRAAAPQRHDA